MNKVFLLIDSHALLHRAFHALPPLATAAGREVGALFGFSSSLLKALDVLKPTAVIAAFDLPQKTFRHELYEEYKATREKTPITLIEQIKEAPRVLKSFGINSVSMAGAEADDIIATATARIRKEHPDAEVIILTGDLDTLQLVDARTRIATPQRSTSPTGRQVSKEPFAIYDASAVMKRFGVGPEKFAEYKTLVGDTSDNIPGIAGIGPKTAATILSQYASPEEALARGGLPEKMEKKLRAALPDIERYRKLVTLTRDLPLDLPLEKFSWKGLDTKALASLFSELEFRSLADRIGQKKTPGPERDAPLASGEERTLLLEEKISAAESAGAFSPQIAGLERKLIPIMRAMEKTGILIDQAYLSDLKDTLRALLAEKEKALFTNTGRSFNPASPKQVSQLLFEELKIAPKGIRKTKGGKLSAAAPELEKIKEAHALIPILLEWREIAKLLSTYAEALPKLIHPKDGRLHTTFDQFGAETGRISSSNPNLQNIPVKSELGKKIRRAFIADPNMVLLSADYSQIELRVAAVLADDEVLLDIFKEGKDVHRATASKIFGVPEEEVSPTMRYRAKTINFAVLYGLGAERLAQEAGFSREEAGEFIAGYFANFSGLSRYIAEAKEKARALGYAETYFGRKRFLPEIHSYNHRERAYAERIAVNMPVQGTAADLVKMAMVILQEKFLKDNPSVRLLLQVHDELLFEVPEKIIPEIAPQIRNAMERIANFPMHLVIDMSYGSNWADLVELNNEPIKS